MAQSSGKRRTSIGVLFWIAFILLVLVIFLANRSNIEQVLESTGIVEVVQDRFGPGDDGAEGEGAQTDATSGAQDGTESQGPDADGRVVVADPDAEANPPAEPGSSESTPSPDGSTGTGESGASSGAESAAESAGEQRAQDPADGAQGDRPTEEPDTAPDSGTETRVATEPARQSPPAQRQPSPDPEKPNRLMADLYFIKVTDDGRTFPQRVVRPVYYASSPLTETIHALIAGPTGDELNDGLLNLIPEGTQLISAHVSNGTAYLNFNQEFRFNPLGAEGTVAQLLQVIYSSTEFPTVERVQFLVDGEALDYLGGDGIYVGEPLGRNAFSS